MGGRAYGFECKSGGGWPELGDNTLIGMYETLQVADEDEAGTVRSTGGV